MDDKQIENIIQKLTVTEQQECAEYDFIKSCEYDSDFADDEHVEECFREFYVKWQYENSCFCDIQYMHTL